MMMNRREILKAATAVSAITAFSVPAFAQAFPTVQEVLFDPEIPVLGNPGGDVTIAEYFDYQCPYCKRGHEDLMDVVRKDGNVRLVMKDWPIFGEASVHASSLVLAADDYKKALSALMATPGRLRKEEVDAVLKDVGLDPSAFFNAFMSDMGRIDGILARNMDQANAFGFRGTPSFIIGTNIYRGAMDKQALREGIKAARES